MAYKAVIFDYDDTLVQTWRVKWAHHKAVAKRYYNIELTDETLAAHWGKPFPELTGILYKHSDSFENMNAALNDTEHEFLKTLQPDADSVLTKLTAASLPLAIVTSMTHDYTINDMGRLGIAAEQFTFIQGADDTPHHKPDPRVFDPAIEAFADIAEPAEIVYVGDALIDCAAAKAAGLNFIGITTGRDSEADFNAIGVFTVKNLEEASRLILGVK